MIPPGTSINTNMVGILMNPENFPQPKIFQPSRFIDPSTGKFKPHPEVVPFGVGKRRCLGETLAKLELFVFFTGLMHKFKVHFADDGSKPPTTDYRPGITLCPQPFKVCFISRN